MSTHQRRVGFMLFLVLVVVGFPGSAVALSYADPESPFALDHPPTPVVSPSDIPDEFDPFQPVSTLSLETFGSTAALSASQESPSPTVATVIFCDFSISPTPTPTSVIPEPGTFILVLLGVLIVWLLARCTGASSRTTMLFVFLCVFLLLTEDIHDLIAQLGCTLTVARQGAGSGRVAGGPIDCGDACRLTQGNGETLTLTAFPDSGSAFSGWLVNGDPYVGPVQMSDDTTLTARFTPEGPPVADFTVGPVRGYAPLTVTMTATSLGEITAVTWDFGDDHSSSAAHPTHVYEHAGTYAVSLTVTGPGGSDTRTHPDLIEVLQPNQVPMVTITSPADGAVVRSGDVVISGTVVDDGTVTSVLVNEVPATLVDSTLTVTLPLDTGNHTLAVIAEDDVGEFGVAEGIVRVDGEGPQIDIQAPARGQAVSTLTPSITISYSDFYADVDRASLQVLLTDEHDVSRNVTADLTSGPTGASGTLSTPLTADTRYTLTISLADTLGNLTQDAAAFYVPIDPADIVPPEVPEHAGWATGTVYDSSNCTEHLRNCAPLAGAHVTLTRAGDPDDAIPGTIVTGPTGFFAFPLPETSVYWLRVEKAGYTYGQRAIEVVRRHSTATSNIYLTPLDAAVSSCTATGCAGAHVQCGETSCSHTNSDGTMQVIIPHGAIAAGEVVEVTATNFRNVEFLPSGELPPGTWETYAFNLGGESEVTFETPMTVKMQNYRGFAAGEQIPLGYWNQETRDWEHEGFGMVDETGDWVVMTVTHFSNYDCNYTVSVPPVGDSPPPPPTNQTAEDEPGTCSEGTTHCFIDFKSGTFTEDYLLPPVPVLGQDVAPRLLYSSRRAYPNAVIDLEFAVDAPAALGYTEFELFIEGRKTDNLVLSTSPGAAHRYRYWWDGRDAQGRRLPSGIYPYQAVLRVPYGTQYYQAYRFGGQLIPTQPTGRTVEATYDYGVSGTILLDAEPDSPFGAGWVLAGQQRLSKDEAGRILISDGQRNDRFYAFPNDLLGHQTLPAGGEDLLAWLSVDDEGQSTLHTLPESLARIWPPVDAHIAVGGGPAGMAVSPDGTRAYVTKAYEDTLAVLDVTTQQALTSIPVGSVPQGIALSPDGTTAYVANAGSGTLSVVNLVTGIVDPTPIAVGTEPYGIAVSADGTRAYVTNRGENTLSVVDLSARQEVDGRIPVGYQPHDVALSPDGTVVYVTNYGADSVAVIDLSGEEPAVDFMTVGSGPTGIALSPGGAFGYVANQYDQTVSVLDLTARQPVTIIAVWGDSGGGVGGSPSDIVLSPDGRFAYVANGNHRNLSVLDLNLSREIIAIDVSIEASRVARSPDGTMAYVVGLTSIAVVDVAMLKHLQSVDAGQHPSALALSPDSTQAYVTSAVHQTVSVVDVTAPQTPVTFSAGSQPQGIAISPAGNHAYLVNQGDETVSVIDLATQDTIASIPVAGQPHGIAVTGSASDMRAYVTTRSDGTLAVIDLDTYEEVERIPVGSASQDVVLSADGERAYLTHQGQNVISVLDLTLPDPMIIDTIFLNMTPASFTLSSDEVYAYAANEYGDIIGVIDLTAREQIAMLQTRSPVAMAHLRSRATVTTLSEGDLSRLEYDPETGTYTRLYPSGARVHFHADGTHASTVDRHGNRTSYTYHPDGTTASMTITPAGSDTPSWVWTFAYAGGVLSEIRDPAGRVTTFDITGSNHLTAITDPGGRVRTFTYDARGLMTQETDELGHSTTHVYDQYGRITQVTEAPTTMVDPGSGQRSGAQETIDFRPMDTAFPFLNEISGSDPDSPAPAPPVAGDLTARVDYERGSLEGHLDRWGRWLSKTDAVGQTTTYQRDSAGNLLQRTHPDGSCEAYSYTGTGLLLSKSKMDAAQCALAPEHRDPAQAQTTRYTYEERFNRLNTTTDPLGNITTYIYDYEEDAGNAGNLIRIESPEVEDETGTTVTPTVRYSYNGWGQVTSVTDEQGTVTRYVYTQGTSDEAFGEVNARFQDGVTPVPGLLTQLVKDESGANQTTTYTNFDAFGNPGTVIGPGCCGNGQVTQYTYDTLGRVLTKTDTLGIVTKYEYDATGNVIRTIDDYTEDGTTGRNVVTEYSYDSQGNLLRERTEADGFLQETTYAYDENGKLASVTDANGHTTTYTYDDADQLDSVTDPQNQTTSYIYTDKGQVETVTLPNSTVIKYVYNALGQKVQEIKGYGGLNLTTNYTYDANGNLKTVTDANLKTTTYSYDALNQLKTVEDPLMQATQYTYDQAGHLRFLTDAKTQTTGLVYDALGRLKQETRPLGQATTYEYNDAGKLSEKEDAKGQRIEYVYEPQTNLLTDIYYYDSAGAQTGYVTFSYDNGLLTGYDDGTTSAVYTYDAFRRKLSETVNYGPFPKTFRYTYYSNGQKQSFTMPDGTTYSYSYNNNELRNVRIPGVGNISYPSYTMSRPDSVTFPSGSQHYQYDALMRLKNIDAQNLDYAYTYDHVSNILTTQTEHGNYAYDYDDLYRLTDVDNPTQADEAYTYDGVGNRATASNATGTITHNANNELLKYGDISYNYDANGNMVAQTSATETRQYVYNAQNRLVRVEDGSSGVIAEYYYDPFGRRLWKDVDGTRTYFFYADEGLVVEYDESGNEIRSYGYQPDSTWTTDPLWLKEGGDYYWYQNDHLGTPQKLIDITGTVVWAAQYTAFGEAQIQVETVTNNLRFPGQYYDAETGLYYNYQRFYDPQIGRYTQVDPIGFDGGDVNLYVYVGNNSVNGMDAYGLQTGIEVAVGFCVAKPEICIAIGYGIGVGICTVAGWCQPFPLDIPGMPPFRTPLSPPAIPGPYPELQPIPTLFFPRLPSLAETCDPDDGVYFPPEETWKGTKGEPDNPNKYKGSEPPDCGFVCDMCWFYLNKDVGWINAAKATVACFECGRCLAGLWD